MAVYRPRLHLAADKPFAHLTVCGRPVATAQVSSVAALSEAAADRCESCWRMRSQRRRAIQTSSSRRAE